MAFWNGEDPFLKERLFGLAGPQGNHGEDCKEYYFYLDNTPTHSYCYMKVNEDGSVALISSAVEIGAGQKTVLAQIAADSIGNVYILDRARNVLRMFKRKKSVS